MKDLELVLDVDLGKCSLDLPAVDHFVGRHPQRPSPAPSLDVRQTYVFLLDMLDEGKVKDLECAKRLSIPIRWEVEMSAAYSGCWEFNSATSLY